MVYFDRIVCCVLSSIFLGKGWYMRFKDRNDAGQQLAHKLLEYANNPQVRVCGLARGGVVTAHTIAQVLQVPCDVIIVRKIGSLYNPELALGALSEDGSLMLDAHYMRLVGETAASLQPVIEQEMQELERRKKIYRGGKALPDMHNKIVILADDGVATGSTMKAALKTVIAQKPQQIIIAVPVASSEFLNDMRQEGIKVVCITLLDPVGAISPFYEHFPQVTDEQVVQLLK